MLVDFFLPPDTKERLESEFSGQTAQHHGMLTSVAPVSLHCVYVTCNVFICWTRASHERFAPESR